MCCSVDLRKLAILEIPLHNRLFLKSKALNWVLDLK